MSRHKIGDQIYVKCKVVGFSDEDDPVIELTDWGNRVAVAGEEICTETYEDGVADAWKAARKIVCTDSDGGLCGEELSKIFGTTDITNIIVNNTAQEAIAKIKAHDNSLSDTLDALSKEVRKMKTLTCEVCGSEIIPHVDHHYISRDAGMTGMAAAFRKPEEMIYDTFDCDQCGCQHIAQERKREYIDLDAEISREEEREDDED